MLAKLFATSKKPLNVPQKQEMEKEEDSQIALKNADRELLKFPYPKLESGMTDHIIGHQRGEKFQYVALRHPNVETKKIKIEKTYNLYSSN
jgi:hypothetical protein